MTFLEILAIFPVHHFSLSIVLASQQIASSLTEKGIEMLDASVSGGQPKAIEGTLSVLVGGKQEVGAPLPLTAFVMEIMQALKTEGLGDSDHGAMVQYFEKQTNVEIKRAALM